MTKNYFYSVLFFLVLGTASVAAQEAKPNLKESNSIEGLSFYPNPVTGGKLYITTRNNDDKNITIYDVLGKKVFQTVLSSRELNLSTLQPGVYFIKIEEGDASATRKLIVR
ncbi:T9SS type A sorting domain-containing protein [Flavobacterium stagni]|uniref:T9SS type A sorting domain-containing protein n=1 Tax=Flavobacterium stagni TaxID=2506421 RepID=A0A4Q1KFQ8_9FLAO|nr:T9SS type A sorting domain-containing protein [Flavobacterium stagni]RXR24618.1 T9SS type A sorting domain-containing protein [Flavobacterium stagni]